MGIASRGLARTAVARIPSVRPLARGLDALSDPLVGATAGAATLLLLVTATLAFHPELAFVAADAGLDLVMNTASLSLAGVVAGISWARFRETRRGATVLLASAFLVLAFAGGVAVISMMRRGGVPAGISGGALLAPGIEAIHLGLLIRLAVATLFVGAALAQLRGWSPSPGAARAVLLAPVGVLLLFAVGLPSLAADPPVDPVTALSVGVPADMASRLVGLAAGGALAVAACLFLRHYVIHGERTSAVLALALVVAAFGQLTFGLAPSMHGGVVTVEDVLRVAFATILLSGLVVQQHSDLAALHRANVRLARYRDADIQRARVEERARLARDLHDGLAQKLWRARLLQGRLAEFPELEDRARALSRESEAALGEAILEARAALDAMRAVGGHGSLRAALKSELDEFERRTGIRTDLAGSAQLTEVPHRLRPEVQGILREALANVERHADATLVRVRLERNDGWLEMTVRDNGRGFVPGRPQVERYGLLGMHERAELLGARLTVASAPAAGTRIDLAIPIDPRWAR